MSSNNRDLVAENPSVSFVLQEDRDILITNVGSVTGQGDLAMRADEARNTFNVDGSGVTIGVLSDSFNTLGGANDDIASGDLPGAGNPLGNTIPVNVLEESAIIASDEGRAMIQLIHDVAPGADFIFHTGVSSQAGFADAVTELAEAGADIIVDDILYLREPMFQDGVIAQAVDKVVADGVSYFAAAGSTGRGSYESAFNPSGQFEATSGGEFHDFQSGAVVDTFQSINVFEGQTIRISFQWDSPFFSVSGGSGSPNDLNIFLYDSTGTNILASSTDSNVGGDPVEVFTFTNDGSFGTNQFNLAITKSDGPNPELMKYVLFGGVAIDEFDTNSSTVYGHANAAGAEAVGVALYDQTPEFGVVPPNLQSFSSAGPTPILFETDGTRTFELRQKPEIIAPHGTNNTFFGNDTDGDGLPNFFGTSAGAPHAAGVAALMLDAVPDATPAEIYQALESTALDMDDPFTPEFDSGFDDGSGFGFIQADLAIAELLGSGEVRNGGFENGDFNSWKAIGNASTQTAEFGSIPTEGNFQALITTALGIVSDTEIEAFLDLNLGAIDLIDNGDTTEGSALQKQVVVEAGDILSFDFSLLTNETVSEGDSGTFNDFAFVSVIPNTNLESGTNIKIADISSASVVSPTRFELETGYDNFTYEFTEAGTYKVGIGIVDAGDEAFESGLLVDDFKVISQDGGVLFPTDMMTVSS
ncbi:S8 family serine peptidase [Mastigocoleus testarum]|uniref:Peptidase S8/S53 domain-containing protein n=1 Tax=Mastigocoleus testarum BC008 TaxID=371196 RepID=A0A0V7ZNY1_9CYAN|nr:S8 family serine peptidase [Mastigocoleus testarum]KST65541.1 hypothetical protein BC008_42215 [Mastigocoleus testarum BC008]KST66071.1 hypothetical protein BC008_24140 [Mastigocoleus testarum BC008]